MKSLEKYVVKISARDLPKLAEMTAVEIAVYNETITGGALLEYQVKVDRERVWVREGHVKIETEFSSFPIEKCEGTRCEFSGHVWLRLYQLYHLLGALYRCSVELRVNAEGNWEEITNEEYWELAVVLLENGSSAQFF
jgi:hypothetical protein